MSKVCQYDNKVYKGLMQVDVKDAQAILQKTITRTKKSSKGRQEWEKVCIECGLLFRKLKTLVKTRFLFKVIMFEKTSYYHLLWEAKDYCFTTKSSKSPSVGYYSNNYFYMW